MITIFSKSNDQTTTDVVEWLISLGACVLRVNSDKPQFTIHEFILNDKEVNAIIIDKSDNKLYNLLNTKAYWYRRGVDLFQNEIPQKAISEMIDHEIRRPVLSQVSNEIRIINQYIHFLLRTKSN